MEDKENNMNMINTDSSIEVQVDLDALLLSLISHLYDAYSSSSSSESSDSTSDSDLDSESETCSSSESTSDFDTCLSSEATSDYSENELTILQFLDQGSDSSSDLPNSVLREKSASIELLDTRIVSQFLS